ncbi:phage holin family protein [Nitratidesulfovibrio vulgaris]|uniref:phage holin family protein n=1 Tax=Nitratidesulfovibrio vulgaris TaxID=881 RepID=UPI0001A80066|nr:phage holin family protein [Nitratidesulfovibrio vulgaris]ADP87165.1 toxin secretion/phage lysis holin [Nitratidesulfovibrio vulgaris RCH1]
MHTLDQIGSYARTLCEEFPVKASIGTCAAFVGTLLGGVGMMISLLFLLLVIDFALGFCRAWRAGRVSSSKLRGGGLKFVFYFLSIVVMAAVQAATSQSTGMTIPLRDVFVAYLCVNEGLSCLEHLSYFGVPVPEKIRERLRAYRDNLCTSK